MAKMLEITVENGSFKGVKGTNVQNVEKSRIVGDEWLVQIKPDSSIEALCMKDYKDGIHSIRAVITEDGKFKATRRVPTKDGYETKLIKCSILEKRGIKYLNGTLMLSLGKVDSRYVYFHGKAFEHFMKVNSLSKFLHTDPNREYLITDCDIFTDGLVEQVDKKVAISEATWVINEKEGKRTLYTLKGFKKLSLPLIIENVADCLKTLSHKFKNVEDAKAYMNTRFMPKHFDVDNKLNDYAADRVEIRASYWIDTQNSKIYIKVYQWSYWDTPESVKESGVKELLYDAKKEKFYKKDLLLSTSVDVLVKQE